MGKSNITLPPQKKSISATALVADEKKISAVINKGGSTTKTVNEPVDTFKNFNIKLLISELSVINELRDRMPKPRGKRIAISLHDWIISAIKEKIERDTEKE